MSSISKFGSVVSGASVLTLLLTTLPAAASAPVGGITRDFGIQATCAAKPTASAGAVNVRTEKSTGSSIRHVIQSGEYVSIYTDTTSCTSEVETGGSYTACGGGNTWIYVWYGTGDFQNGWAARKCLTIIAGG